MKRPSREHPIKMTTRVFVVCMSAAFVGFSQGSTPKSNRLGEEQLTYHLSTVGMPDPPAWNWSLCSSEGGPLNCAKCNVTGVTGPGAGALRCDSLVPRGSSNGKTCAEEPGQWNCPSTCPDNLVGSGLAGGLARGGQNCWHQCNKKQGPCGFCGTGYCCRKGYHDHSSGCDGTLGIDGLGHVCVAAPGGPKFWEPTWDRADGRCLTVGDQNLRGLVSEMNTYYRIDHPSFLPDVSLPNPAVNRHGDPLKCSGGAPGCMNGTHLLTKFTCGFVSKSDQDHGIVIAKRALLHRKSTDRRIFVADVVKVARCIKCKQRIFNTHKPRGHNVWARTVTEDQHTNFFMHCLRLAFNDTHLKDEYSCDPSTSSYKQFQAFVGAF